MTDSVTRRTHRRSAAATVGSARPIWGWKLAMVLLVVVSVWAVPRPAPATARSLEAEGWSQAVHPSASFVADAGQHGIEKREAPHSTGDRRVARWVGDSAHVSPLIERPCRAAPAKPTDPIFTAPSSRADGGNSSRAPPRLAGVITPLA